MPGMLFDPTHPDPIIVPDWMLREILSLWHCTDCNTISHLFDLDFADGSLICTTCGSYIDDAVDEELAQFGKPCGSARSGPGVPGAEPPGPPYFAADDRDQT